MPGRKKSILKLIEKMETYMEEHDIHPEDYYIVTGVGLWVEEYEQFKNSWRKDWKKPVFMWHSGKIFRSVPPLVYTPDHILLVPDY